MNYYELSPSQKRLWSLFKMGSSMNNQVHVVFPGSIDLGALEKAFRAVVEKHDILRAGFASVSYLSFPLQFARTAALPMPAWTFLDITSEHDSRARIRACALELRKKNYNWQEDTLFDLFVIPTDQQNVHLIFQMPAICGDATTCLHVMREMACHYYDQELPGEATSFFQYAQWHNDLVKAGEAEDIEYWRNKYAWDKFDYRLPIEVDVAQQPVLKRTGIDLDDALIKGIHNFVNQHKISCEAFFLGLWQLFVLQYFEESEEIGVGMVVDGRFYEAFQEICGPLSRTLPFITRADREGDVADLLHRTELQLQELKERQFAAGIPALSVFPVCFEYLEAGTITPTSTQGFQLHEIFTRSDDHRLKLLCLHTTHGILLDLEYMSDSLPESAVSSIRQNFKSYITRLLGSGKLTVRELIRPSSGEEAIILHSFNTPATPPRAATTVASLFEEQARLTPGLIAVEDDDRKLTFAELDRQANQLADYLIKEQNVIPGDIVAVQLPRTVEMIVGLIGVIKAGAAFLPIDPAWPEKRLSYILKDSHPRLVLSKIPVLSGTVQDITPPLRNGGASSPLYIIYTSGSTGDPKGVIISNASFLNYITWFRDSFHIGPKDSTCLFSSIAYDLCYTALWSSLLSGARLVLLQEFRYLEPELLINKLIDHSITYIKLTPSHFRMLTADADLIVNAKRYCLRLVVIGGENIIVGDLEKYFRHREDVVFVNHYGPTETTVGAIYCPVTREQFAAYKHRPLIGRPVTGNKVYILGRDHRLLPVGVTGEIGIAGAGVGMGYFNNEKLTREKFIPNPYEAGETLYLTGDMGRYMPDGSIEFLGRRDHQVKVRGYRVELQEIAGVIASFPEVLEAEVVAADKQEQEITLAAFFTSAVPVDIRQLKAHVEQLLPAYMVPPTFVNIEKFPLTQNGKKDHLRLLDLLQDRKGDEGGYIAPGNFLETRMAAIWEEVLGLSRVGATDNFFAIGGHSLKAVQIISRVYKELHIRMQMRDIFEHPTIKALAGSLAALGTVNFEPIGCIPESQYYEVSNAQKRLWVASQLETEGAIYNLPFAYLMEGELNIASMEKALDAMAGRHEMLRTTFHEVEGRLKQRIHPHASFPLRLRQVDLRSDAGRAARVNGLIKDMATERFDLSKGPLVKALLVHMEEDLFAFVLVMHHIVSDAWSMEVFLNEFQSYYRAYSSGTPSSPAPLRIQYKDYAVWHNRLVAGDGMAQHRKFWHNMFQSKAPSLGFPTDLPRQRVKSFKGGIVESSFTSAQLSCLRSISEKYDATLFITLLALLNAILYRYTGVQDIVIGTPVAQRDHPDLEDQIGLYLNSLALRTRFRGKDSFSDLLLKVRAVALDAYSHQVYPYDVLVSELDLKADAGRSPLFDVVMLLNKEKLHEEDNPGPGKIKISRMDPGDRVSTVDMRIVFTESGDRLSCAIEYDAALFNESSIAKFLEDFLVITDQAAGDNDIRIFDLLVDNVATGSAGAEIRTVFNI
ncbi:amino acid adenylation domain-containing protein [Flavitalea sp. BT771]|uniref:amino acid adenylation domain-containing protein n=1 Tax=Flavitalea sp. BT771 TaxID=3063329 RepID=UPI0026E2267C|nr:amino acid adenylation domain-containing protein [Flavitalea sp. BT771]MDO6435714.1 amino acid adenylation domain-containing protein [Flavitalea sp. BT771]MDV6224625.1 amino acid adenylation domain-containing protein [Flavitalea sp. BT771]